MEVITSWLFCIFIWLFIYCLFFLLHILILLVPDDHVTFFYWKCIMFDGRFCVNSNMSGYCIEWYITACQQIYQVYLNVYLQMPNVLSARFWRVFWISLQCNLEGVWRSETEKISSFFKGNLLLLAKYEPRSLQFLQDLVHGRPTLRITVVSVRCVEKDQNQKMIEDLIMV